jgi:hypothetical protein
MIQCGLAFACSGFIMSGTSAVGDEKTGKEKPALSGLWEMKGGEMKIEFADKKAIRIIPHGDSNIIVIACEYNLDKDGLVKVKITGFEGKEDAKEAVKNILPVGTQFSFKWKAKDDMAKLDEIKGDQADHLKSHLEGEYSQKK